MDDGDKGPRVRSERAAEAERVLGVGPLEGCGHLARTRRAARSVHRIREPSETESTMLSRAAPSPKSKIGEPSFEQLAHGDWPLTEIP